jgi:N-acetyl-gamma-glutamyl-phosphate reductase
VGLSAAVAGASGYAGGELLRLLAAHPQLTLGEAYANTAAGRPVTELHPQLPDLADRVFAEFDPRSWQADVLFLALPHGESARLAEAVPDGVLLVDLGSDHRHAAGWTYGLPELPGRREALAGSRRIASPGCYATAVIVALSPLLDAGLVEPADLVVVAASGTSGAGRGAREELLGAQVMGDLSAYQVGGGHRHIPEIARALGVPGLSFTPLLAPLPRGILATATARIRPGTDEADLRAALSAVYSAEPFVRLLSPGNWPHTAATVGGNCVQLQVSLDRAAGRAIVVAALDNLGKGAAGQAVQAANLALGLPESSGLSVHGVAP